MIFLEWVMNFFDRCFDRLKYYVIYESLGFNDFYFISEEKIFSKMLKIFILEVFRVMFLWFGGEYYYDSIW